MTHKPDMREQAIKRLRDASQRLAAANEELRDAQFELFAAAAALDRLEDVELPTADDVRGILRADDENKRA